MLLRILLLLVLASILLGCSEFDPVDLPGEYGWSWSREPDFTPRDIWSDGETIVVAGMRGRIRRFDGESWHEDVTETVQNLSDLDGLSLDSLWAVGENGVILQFDGTKWRKETSPSAVHLNAIDVGMNGTVAAVGDHGRLLIRSDGVWTKRVAETSEAFKTVFVDVDGVVWCSGYWTGLNIFDGSSFSLSDIPSPNYVSVHDMARHPDGTLYVLSGSYLYTYRDGEWENHLHRTGDRIRIHSNGSIEVFSDTHIDFLIDDIWERTRIDINHIEHIEPFGEHDYVIIVDTGAVMTGNINQWNIQDQIIRIGAVMEIVALPHGRLLAGTFYGAFLVWDGNSWGEPISVFDGTIVDMAVDTNNDVYMLDIDGHLMRWREGMIENLGRITQSWNDLSAIRALGDGRVMAVGRRGKVIITNGRAGETLTPFTDARLYEIWGSGANDVYVAGRRELWHWDGDTWKLEIEDKFMRFYAIQGDGDGRVIAAGWDGGNISVRQPDGQWINHVESWDAAIRNMALTPSGAVYASGNDGGMLWIGDGQLHWIDPPAFNIYLLGIECDTEGAAFVGTSYGGIYRYGR